MIRIIRPILVLAAATALAGCNEATGGGMAAPIAETPVAASFHLPPGAPCTKEIDGFENVLKSDLDTGNVEQKVYDEVQRELTRAAAACSAGKGGESHSIVAGSKARHGYRA